MYTWLAHQLIGVAAKTEKDYVTVAKAEKKF